MHVARHATHVGYVDVRFGKLKYTMKPVLSTTGALRFEDVDGRALMIQIPSKSMLMDVRQGRRLVDECMHDSSAWRARRPRPTQAKPGIGIDPSKAALEAEAAAAAASVAAAAAALGGTGRGGGRLGGGRSGVGGCAGPAGLYSHALIFSRRTGRRPKTPWQVLYKT